MVRLVGVETWRRCRRERCFVLPMIPERRGVFRSTDPEKEASEGGAAGAVEVEAVEEATTDLRFSPEVWLWTGELGVEKAAPGVWPRSPGGEAPEVARASPVDWW